MVYKVIGIKFPTTKSEWKDQSKEAFSKVARGLPYVGLNYYESFNFSNSPIVIFNRLYSAIAVGVIIATPITNFSNYLKDRDLSQSHTLPQVLQLNSTLEQRASSNKKNALINQIQAKYDQDKDGKVSSSEKEAMFGPTYSEFFKNYSNDQLKTLLEAKK